MALSHHSLRWATKNGVALPVHPSQQALCGWQIVPERAWRLCDGDGTCVPGYCKGVPVVDQTPSHSLQFKSLGFKGYMWILGMHYDCWNQSDLIMFNGYMIFVWFDFQFLQRSMVLYQMLLLGVWACGVLSEQWLRYTIWYANKIKELPKWLGMELWGCKGGWYWVAALWSVAHGLAQMNHQVSWCLFPRCRQAIDLVALSALRLRPKRCLISVVVVKETHDIWILLMSA